VGPVPTNVGYFVAPIPVIMFVVAGRMAILIVVCVIVSEYVAALLVSGVISIPIRPSFLTRAYSPDRKVLRDIENDAIMAENVPGNLASFRGRQRDF